MPLDGNRQRFPFGVFNLKHHLFLSTQIQINFAFFIGEVLPPSDHLLFGGCHLAFRPAVYTFTSVEDIVPFLPAVLLL